MDFPFLDFNWLLKSQIKWIYRWSHDIQHDNNQHKDPQHNNTQQNAIQHDTQHNNRTEHSVLENRCLKLPEMYKTLVLKKIYKK